MFDSAKNIPHLFLISLVQYFKMYILVYTFQYKDIVFLIVCKQL